jgi:cell division protein FtsQ
LNSGTTLELGSGSTPELLARLERFLKTVTQATARYSRTVAQLDSVDLRHTDGYAIRLDGVTTVSGDDAKTAKQGNR